MQSVLLYHPNAIRGHPQYPADRAHPTVVRIRSAHPSIHLWVLLYCDMHSWLYFVLIFKYGYVPKIDQ